MVAKQNTNVNKKPIDSRINETELLFTVFCFLLFCYELQMNPITVYKLNDNM